MMTEDEMVLTERLGYCADEYARLYRAQNTDGRRIEEHDVGEFVAHVHDLQARVMWLAARRAPPDRLR